MANASYPRAQRVRRAIREIIADELERMADPGLGLVTITDVTISPDLRHAKAFYTVYGSDVTTASSKDALKRATGHLRSTIAKQVRLRYTPTLEFELDPVPQRAAHIDDLIAQVHRSETGSLSQASLRDEEPNEAPDDA